MTEVEKKKRNPRKDYGFARDAVIKVVPDGKSNYRGEKNKVWFERVKGANGQTVGVFLVSYTEARGWLRFFASKGSIVLEKEAA